MRCGTGSGLPRIECGPPEPISSNLVESCDGLSCWTSHGIGVLLHGRPGRIGHKPRATWNRTWRCFLPGLQGCARGNAADKRFQLLRWGSIFVFLDEPSKALLQMMSRAIAVVARRMRILLTPPLFLRMQPAR